MRSPFLPGGSGGRGGPACARIRKRNREFLEQFSLDTLKMVGTLKLGGSNYGLVQTKDGLVHRVSARQLHRPGRRQDHRDLAFEDQCRRNRSGRPRRLHGAPRSARAEPSRSTAREYQE